jgi:UMF1 family MFS transporter
MRRFLHDRPILAWALYDWANSAFATTVMAAFFPVFYSVLSDELSTEESQFWFNITLSGSSIVLALAAPVLGAIADRGGNRKRFLATFAMLGVTMSMALAWVQDGMWMTGLVIYALGQMGFAGANIFYDSMLVDISDEDDFDLVSGFGYAMGYIGGGLLFLLNVLMVTNPAWFGLADTAQALSWAFISVGVWWAVFTLPLLLWVREMPTVDRAGGLTAIREGMQQLRETFSHIRRLRVVFLFLAAYWLYIDGVGSVIKMAVFFADRVLELPRDALISALLVTQFVSFPAALFFGWLGRRIGPRNGILIGLLVYMAAVFYAWGWLTTGAGFYLLAIAIGLVQGGVQSLSRSLYARIIPADSSAEFFGFYNMVGKFAAILGPLLMALVPIVVAGADARDAILVLILVFLVGGAILTRVNVEAGMRQADAMEQDR